MPMWVYDLETLAFMAVNTAAIVHYGFSESEFLALTIADLRPPEELPKLFANLRNAPLDTLEKSGTWRHRKKTAPRSTSKSRPTRCCSLYCACKFVLAHDVTERIHVLPENRPPEPRVRPAVRDQFGHRAHPRTQRPVQGSVPPGDHGRRLHLGQHRDGRTVRPRAHRRRQPGPAALGQGTGAGMDRRARCAHASPSSAT
ncbi:PAS domain-containing protein [Massilia sp. B-10]|nr:PAS domain-containing protein [Massilia sp. B-10]